MKVEFIFAWYDLWVGAFWDSKKRWLYILPIPMCGVIIKLNPKTPSIPKKYRKVAVYSNNDKLSELVVLKLLREGLIQPGDLKKLGSMVWLVDSGYPVSHLALEMHYPEYELMYGDKFLEL